MSTGAERKYIPPGLAGQVAAMFGHLPPNLLVGVWSTDLRTRWADSGDLGALCRHALEVDASGLDAFLLVNPRVPGLGEWKRGTTEQVAALIGQWADVDHDLPGHAPAASGLAHPTKAEADEVLATSVPRPTLRWATGGGEHLVWLYSEPVAITDANRDERQALCEAWHSHLAESFRRARLHFDETGDLPRHLRSVATHRRKAGTEHRVTLDDELGYPSFGVFDDAGRIRRDWRPEPTYTPEELASWAKLRLAEPPKGPRPEPRHRRQGSRNFTDSPAEYVDASYSWADVLEPAGWHRVGSGTDPELWHRGRGATSRYSAKCWEHAAVVWSSAAGLPVGKARRLSKFRILAHLAHGGDESACARAVRAEMSGGAK